MDRPGGPATGRTGAAGAGPGATGAGGSRSAASPASAVSRRARSASAVLAGGKVAHVRLRALLAGHKTRTVFDRYTIVSHRDLHTAATLLEGGACSLDPHGAHHGERGSTTGHGGDSSVTGKG